MKCLESQKKVYTSNQTNYHIPASPMFRHSKSYIKQRFLLCAVCSVLNTEHNQQVVQMSFAAQPETCG